MDVGGKGQHVIKCTLLNLTKRPWFDISVHTVRKLYYVHTIKWLYKNTTESQTLPDTFKETKQW